MADHAPRVVVLGRPGDAQQQLQNALNELGAQTLAVGDFDQLDPAAMREQQPDVWLVSMDESTDAAGLERWQPLFDDPDATVVFDDADVTKRLSGWDLARWARHLAAKVLGRDDVLPPVSPDAERLPQPSAPESGEPNPHISDVGAPLAMDTVAHDDFGHDDNETVATSQDEDAAFAALSASFEAERLQQEADTEAHPPALALDDLLRDQSDTDIGSGNSDQKIEAAPAEPASTPAAASLSGLSLLDMDADLSAPHAVRAAEPHIGIDVAHLELEPIMETEAGAVAESSTNGGLIAIIAGLGGPDAVRQFLGALPSGLTVPVLLWQHLDAGKHDRLAQQLGKATKLPVYLAKIGELAKTGAIGVVGVGLGILGDSGWWFESGSPSPSHGLAAALNDPGTVIAILSGAEPAIIERARAHAASGGLVLVQTPSTCFDGTAAAALENQQGVTTGSPAELARLAAEPKAG